MVIPDEVDIIVCGGGSSGSVAHTHITLVSLTISKDVFLLGD